MSWKFKWAQPVICFHKDLEVLWNQNAQNAQALDSFSSRSDSETIVTPLVWRRWNRCSSDLKKYTIYIWESCLWHPILLLRLHWLCVSFQQFVQFLSSSSRSYSFSSFSRSLIKVKFSTDQFRPALGSCGCRLIVDCHHAQKTYKLPYFRLFRPDTQILSVPTALY